MFATRTCTAACSTDSPATLHFLFFYVRYRAHKHTHAHARTGTNTRSLFLSQCRQWRWCLWPIRFVCTSMLTLKKTELAPPTAKQFLIQWDYRKICFLIMTNPKEECLPFLYPCRLYVQEEVVLFFNDRRFERNVFKLPHWVSLLCFGCSPAH